MAAISRRDRKRTNASRDLHKYIHQNKKTLPVPVTSVKTPIRTRVSRRFRVASRPWPVFHLSDWLSTCFNTPEFSGFFFLGGKKISQLEEIEQMFTRFWDRYKHIDANSPSFPARTIPIYIHGDEGRSLVKRPILIVAYQPIIGWGGEHRCNSTKHLCINSSLVGYMGNPRFKIHFLRGILTH